MSRADKTKKDVSSFVAGEGVDSLGTSGDFSLKWGWYMDAVGTGVSFAEVGDFELYASRKESDVAGVSYYQASVSVRINSGLLRINRHDGCRERATAQRVAEGELRDFLKRHIKLLDNSKGKEE